MRKIFLSLGLIVSVSVFAQEKENVVENIVQKSNLHLLLRNSLEIPFAEGEQAGYKLNEARMDLKGEIVENLKYRVRYRLNRSQSPRAIDNAPASLDYAELEYTFGANKQWAIDLGKQANDFGNWEFEKNPTFEYVYSDYINSQQNLFMLGSTLSYKADANNTLKLQAYNAMSQTFSELYTNTQYDTNGLKAAKFPLGFNLIWRGDLLDKKWQTYYSVGWSSVAKNKTNYNVSIGNKLILNQFEAYLDLHHTSAAVDFSNSISSALNAYRNTNIFAEKVQYQSAVLRLDYALTPQWYITGKTIWERVNDSSENGLGTALSSHNTNMIGLEYKPFASQDFKIFGYFSNTNRYYKEALKQLTPNSHANMVGVGMLYYLKAF